MKMLTVDWVMTFMSTRMMKSCKCKNIEECYDNTNLVKSYQDKVTLTSAGRITTDYSMNHKSVLKKEKTIESVPVHI